MTKASKNKGKNVAESSAPAVDHPGSDQDVPSPAPRRAKRARKTTEKQPAPKKPSVSTRLKKLRAMTFKQTRWADHQTLRDLGIFEEVSGIFTRLGLGGLFHMDHLAYQEETIQFLATLAVEDDTSLDISDENRGRLTFKIRGEKYELPLAQLGAIFHFRPGGQVYTLSLDWKEAQGVWSEIAHGKFTKGTSKAANIRHPAIRYAHKFLAHTLFARRETGAVKEEELALITEAIKPILRSTTLSGEITGQPKQLHLAQYLARRFQYFQEWVTSTNDSTPVLNMGGLFTPIFFACGVPIQGIEQAVRASRLDMKHLCSTQFIRGRVKRSYAYEFQLTPKEKRVLLLPCQQSTHLGDRGNIAFKPRVFLLYDPRVEGPIKDLKSSQGENEEEDKIEPPAEIYRSKRYNFTPYAGPVTGEALQKAHEHIGILHRAMRWQQKHIKKLYRKGKKQAKLIKELFKQLGQSTNASTEMVTSEHREEGGSSREPRQRKGKAPIPISSSSSDSGNPCYSMDEDSDATTN